MPILLGVLCGILSLYILAEHEPGVYPRLTAWLFHEAPPVKRIEPRTIHFTLYMLTLAAVGGAVGVLFSTWRKTHALLFLLASLIVIAAFSALGTYLEPFWH